MIFGKNRGIECPNCDESVKKEHAFCPFCGISLLDAEQEKKDFGLLGRSDDFDLGENGFQLQGFGMFEKLFDSVMNGMMKNLDRQFKAELQEAAREEGKNGNIRVFPNGIKIRISGPVRRVPRQQQTQRAQRKIDESQLQRINSLPREKAKSTMKRLGGKLVYEITAPGIETVNDIFISKLESGYEIKAIGKKKIYVNNIPVNLPVTKYSIGNNKIFVEFDEGV